MSSTNISSLRHTSSERPNPHDFGAVGNAEPVDTPDGGSTASDPLRALQIGEDQRAKGRESKLQRKGSPSRIRPVLLGGAAVAAVTALVSAAWLGLRSRPIPVQVTTALPASPSTGGGLAAGGYVRHARIVNVVSRVSGAIASMQVSEGDMVSEGDLIATLDRDELGQEVAENQANVRVAQARLAELRAGGRGEEVAAARAKVDALRLIAGRLERERARTKSLTEIGVLSTQIGEGAENDSLVANKNLEAAQQNLALLEAGPRPQTIAASQAAVEAAKARLARAIDHLGRTEIRAPLSGRVVRKFLDVGATVSFGLPYTEGYNTLGPGSPIVAIGQVDGLEAVADINQTDLGRIARGDKVEVVADAFPGKTFHAQVTRFSPRADRNKNTVEVTVRFDDPVPSELAHDMSVKLGFVSTSASVATSKDLLIPTSAITELAGRKVVFVVENGYVRSRPIATGTPLPSQLVPVKEGLTAGDVIVSANPRGLMDGLKVAPTSATQ